MRAAALGFAVALFASGASGAGAADNDGWMLLSQATVSETGSGEDWRAVKYFPPELEAASEDFTISGYLVPTLPEPYLKTFLLVPDPSNCPFCGDGGYGPVLEVEMQKPLPDLPEGTFVRLQGRLELNASPETFQMFRLVDAIAPELG